MTADENIIKKEKMVLEKKLNFSKITQLLLKVRYEK